MFLCMALFVLWLTINSLSTPLHQSRRHPKHINHASRKVSARRSLDLDKQTTLAAQAATRRKFQNAPALLASQGTSPSYAVPPSLQNTYNRASDDATNITLLSSLPKSSANMPSYSSSAVRVAAAASPGNVNTTTIDSLQDETDGVDDFEYYGLLSFGSQAQPLQIDFDTGSADLWVPVNCGDCGALSPFQASASSSYQNTNQPFAVTYGSGFVIGTLAEDTVSLGSLKVYSQTIGAVNSVSENFADSPNDGLAGMAFGTISNSRKPTFFENLIPQLQAPLFSIYMTRKQAHGSEIYLGGIDVSKADDDTVAWVPVVSQTYWTVSMSGVLVNKSLVDTGNLNAIIDTGTSFIYCPSHVVTAIYKLIPGSAPAPDYGDGFYAYPCDTPITLSFVLGSHTLPLDPRDLNLGQHESDPTGRTCIAAIIDGGPNFSFAILGDAFQKSYVTVFDYSYGSRVGFVKSINE